MKLFTLLFSIYSLSMHASGGSSPSAGAAPEWPKFTETKTVTETIVLTKPGVYDYKNVLHVWKGKNWPCLADKENGPQILRIEASNITVKNFAYVGDGKRNGSNGLGDPIHIATCAEGQGNLCPGPQSNITLDHITGHACEDLITIGTPGVHNVTIQNSLFFGNGGPNADKLIQNNFGKDVKILNNSFANSPRCIRFKPNTTGEVRGNKFYNCSAGLRATSEDADIPPMKNGPVVITVSGNTGLIMKNEGSRVTIK